MKLNQCKVWALGLVAAALFTASIQAQTVTSSNAAPAAVVNTNIPNFFLQVEAWAMNQNTNYNWANVTYQLESGYIQATGVGAADYIAFRKNITPQWHVGFSGQFDGVGAAFNEIEAQGGYALYSGNDFRIDLDLGAGWSVNNKTYIITPGLKAYKMLTINTYAVSGYLLPFEGKGKFSANGEFIVGLGCTF